MQSGSGHPLSTSIPLRASLRGFCFAAPPWASAYVVKEPSYIYEDTLVGISRQQLYLVYYQGFTAYFCPYSSACSRESKFANDLTECQNAGRLPAMPIQFGYSLRIVELGERLDFNFGWDKRCRSKRKRANLLTLASPVWNCLH
jgi:hypothetical protein